MAPYFHVVIESVGSPTHVFLFGDLSKRSLRRKFVRPYMLGKSILKSNEVVKLTDVRRIWIIETREALREALKDLQRRSGENIDRFNQECQYAKISGMGSGWRKEDIIACGRNVTSQFIASGPSVGTWWSRCLVLLNNPWVYGLGVLAISASGAWLLKKIGWV